MKRFVIGDIHGAYKALVQVLKKSKFNRDTDLLICLGDVVDRKPESKECVEELLKVRNLVLVLGNHDLWFLEWLHTGVSKDLWLEQGGRETIDSYKGIVPPEHQSFFEQGVYFHIQDSMIFVHGGLNPFEKDLTIQKPDDLVWNRTMLQHAFIQSKENPDFRFGDWEKIFVGHTPTLLFHLEKPTTFCNVVAMDTGAGWNGRLSIMDIDSEEVWQSGLVTNLYPDHN